MVAARRIKTLSTRLKRWLLPPMLVFAAQVALPQDPPAQPPPPSSAGLRRRLRCAHPANPLRRPFVCKDENYEPEETLTQKMIHDWNNARERMKEVGITLTGSYYGALQTNATGEAPQTWGYAGQLTTSADFNFERMAGVQVCPSIFRTHGARAVTLMPGSTVYFQ
ncbi:MAG: hypothetical protein JOZ60_03715 [Verrucomicrobia bacterium]|nr:hypothetical protein [Verrucomicrobiota bacterium]